MPIGPASKAPNAREIADKAREDRELREMAAFMSELERVESQNGFYDRNGKPLADTYGVVKREPKSIYSPSGRSQFGSVPTAKGKPRIMPDPAFGVEVKGSRVYQRGRFY